MGTGGNPIGIGPKIGFSTGGGEENVKKKNEGLGHLQEQEQSGGVVDSSFQALSHYMNGNGAAIGLGPNTVNALLNHSTFKYRHNRIITGQTKELTGYFGVDMTDDVFHVGDTRVDYRIRCYGGNCNVTYNLFTRDGFWDVDFIDEEVLGGWLGIGRFQADRMGPNLERLGGTPYPYIPSTRTFYFPNPGYKF